MVAEEFSLDIISCDSRQIYRGMNIGTAKPEPALCAKVKHWLIDIVDPSEQYSAFRFALDAADIIRQRNRNGSGTLICGGTGLYFQALSQGLGPQVAADPLIRKHYLDMAACEGNDAVYARLVAVDPVTATSSHPSNIARNIRALEVFDATGVPFSQQKKWSEPPEDIEFFPIVITLPREVMYARINQRVDSMMRSGLLEEFRALRAKGYDSSSPGMHCVGYRELFSVEDGSMKMDSAVELIKQNSRHYAKRQVTWFRHQLKAIEIEADEKCVEKVNKIVRDFLEKK